MIRRLFAIPATTTATTTIATIPPPIMAWGHKLRGFRSDSIMTPSSTSSSSSSCPSSSTTSNIYPSSHSGDYPHDYYQRDENPYDQELGQDTVQRLDYTIKLPLVSYTTKYQHVDVYELQHDALGTVYDSLGRSSSNSNCSRRQTTATTPSTTASNTTLHNINNNQKQERTSATPPPSPSD